jgi:SPP1 gp7 family putative phage head morphogenesis protein
MPLPTFEEALNYATQRKIVLPQEYYDPKNEKQRKELMTVSRLAGLAQIEAINDELLTGLAEGESFEDWKERMLNDPDFGMLTEAHLETVFRNYTQTAYNAGRWSQFEVNKLAVPFLMFSAINDSRTTEICRHRNGIIRPVDDEFWGSSSPPCHHRCRSTLISLTRSQAEKRSAPMTGLNQPEPSDKPAPGWGYKPDTKGIKKSFRDQFKERMARAPSWIQRIIRLIFGWLP